MTTKTFFRKLGSKYVWLNIVLMAIVAIAFVVALSIGTDIYTHHGEAIKVPNLEGKKFEDAKKLMTDAGLLIMVSDTGYNRMLPPDCILQQTPEAGELVKSKRCIFVTVNASQKPTLVIPDVVDNSSLREATAKLKTLGFKVGAPQYVTGEKDWVYGIVARGKNLPPATVSLLMSWCHCKSATDSLTMRKNSLSQTMNRKRQWRKRSS